MILSNLCYNPDMVKESVNLVPISGKTPELNKSNKQLAIRRGSGFSPRYVPHLSLAQILELIQTVQALTDRPKDKERNKLLVQFLFDSCLRVSEALNLRPQDLQSSASGWFIRVFSLKKRSWDVAAISPSIAAQLQAYAYRHQVKPDAVFFPIDRTRVFQIMKEAFERSGITKPEGVGAVHILRHSGAIERLRQTGNPQSIQDQLRHSTLSMTMRYFKTLTKEESLQIQQGVDFQW